MGDDVNKINDYEKNVKALTTEEIHTLAKRFLSNGAVVGILMPEKE